MKPIEHHIIINASPATIFQIYQAVDQWHTWDLDTKAAHLDGPFAVGTRGRIVPSKGTGVPMEVVSMEPDQSFTVRGAITGFKMYFEHELVPHAAKAVATQVTHRISFSGWLAWVLGPLIGRDVDRGLPRTLASLKRLAESHAT